MRRTLSIRRVVFIAGALLTAISIILLVIYMFDLYGGAKRNGEYAEILRGLMPEAQPAITDKDGNKIMPSVNVDGTDFLGIIEMPSHGACLPVASASTSADRFSCRYDGNVYNGSLIIESTNRTGQFDFVKNVFVDDAVYVTDMLGNRFSYIVADIKHVKNVDPDTLRASDCDLVIFVKNIYDFEYIVIYCTSHA